MPVKRLTASSIEALGPGPDGRQIDFWDKILPGFGIRVGKRRRRVWQVRYTFNGHKRRDVIGRCATLDLHTARRLADQWIAKAADGVDPRPQPKTGPDLCSLTFSNLADEYEQRHGKFKRSWSSDLGRLKRDLLPAFGDKLAAEVTGADVEKVLDTMRERGSTVGAARTLETCRAIFRWAVRKKLLRAAPTEGIEAPASSGKRTRFLDDAEIGRYWRALGAIADDTEPGGGSARTTRSRLLRMMLLVGARGGELRRLRWSDVDFERRLWNAPPERTKAERDYPLPLPPLAVALLEQQRAQHPELVFPRRDGRAEADGTMAAELSREVCDAASIAAFVPHDCRHTLATHLESMGVLRGVIAGILGHRAEFKMTGRYSHYRQEREMRAALESWEKRILELAGEAAPAPSNVVEIKAA